MGDFFNEPTTGKDEHRIVSVLQRRLCFGKKQMFLFHA
jgi:hypothetical protein